MLTYVQHKIKSTTDYTEQKQGEMQAHTYTYIYYINSSTLHFGKQ